MKVLIIGTSGHWHIVNDAVKLDNSIDIAAIAPGCPEEDMTPLRDACPGAREYTNWREMLDNETADVIAVNPWFNLIAEITIECMKKGFDVYSEKPLATSFDQLARLTDAWHKTGRALGGMLNYRYAPWFITMQNVVSQSLIGDVRLIHGQKSYRMGTRAEFYTHRETMGGLIPWIAIHAIDWAQSFGGKCQGVSALHSTGGNRGHGEMEASSAVLLKFENGVIATVTGDYFRPTGSARHDDDRLRLTGTRGMVEVMDGHVYLENEEHRREIPNAAPENAFIAFMNAVRDGKSNEFTEYALEATRISLHARDSADNGGSFISI